MLDLQGTCPFLPPLLSSAERSLAPPPVPPWWDRFLCASCAKAPEAVAILITGDPRVECRRCCTCAFVNRNSLLQDEGKPNPMDVCFQFFIEITIKQIASTHFSLSDVSLMVDLEDPWADFWTSSSARVATDSSLKSQINFIFFFKKWIHLIYSSTWRKLSSTLTLGRSLTERMTCYWLFFNPL